MAEIKWYDVTTWMRILQNDFFPKSWKLFGIEHQIPKLKDELEVLLNENYSLLSTFTIGQIAFSGKEPTYTLYYPARQKNLLNVK